MLTLLQRETITCEALGRPIPDMAGNLCFKVSAMPKISKYCGLHGIFQIWWLKQHKLLNLVTVSKHYPAERSKSSLPDLCDSRRPRRLGSCNRRSHLQHLAPATGELFL